MKTIKRTVIIRDRDYIKVCVESAKTGLYDRISCEPLTYKGLQHENMLNVLKNKSVPPHTTLPDLYREMLYREKQLYNHRYPHWNLTMDYPDGQIWIQSRNGTAREMMLRATFEKDVE